MEESVLSNEEIQSLRQLGIISESEIATRQGDLLVAINVVNQTRRIIESQNVVSESPSKRLLKG